MYTLEVVKEELKKTRAKIYNTAVFTEITKDAIWFENSDDFIDFVKEQKINSLFVYEKVVDTESYTITEDNAKKFDLYRLPECVQEQIKEYNEAFEKANFDYPKFILVIAIWNSQRFCLWYHNDIEFLGKPLLDPDEKILELLEENQAKIEKEEEEDSAVFDEQKKTLKEDILNDEEFKKCTNKQLRHHYMENLIKSKDFKYNIVKKKWMQNERIMYNDAFIFIETVWKEVIPTRTYRGYRR